MKISNEKFYEYCYASLTGRVNKSKTKSDTEVLIFKPVAVFKNANQNYVTTTKEIPFVLQNLGFNKSFVKKYEVSLFNDKKSESIDEFVNEMNVKENFFEERFKDLFVVLCENYSTDEMYGIMVNFADNLQDLTNLKLVDKHSANTMCERVTEGYRDFKRFAEIDAEMQEEEAIVEEEFSHN